MTIYHWLFRVTGWWIGGGMLLGKYTFWTDGGVTGVSRLAGLVLLVLWAVDVLRALANM